MRTITKLAPRDPADDMSHHIGSRVYEHLFKKKLREVTDALQEKVMQTKAEVSHAHR